MLPFISNLISISVVCLIGVIIESSIFFFSAIVVVKSFSKDNCETDLL